MLELNLKKRLSDFELAVNLRMASRVTGLYGPSASGKTTLLNCIAGLTRPDEGLVDVSGRTLFRTGRDGGGRDVDVPVRRRRIGYVFQDGMLFEHMTVADNIAYGRSGQGGPDLGQVVSVLEIGPLLSRRAAELSGGEKRRVAIGRALLSAPDLLLLDEPLAGLDRRLAGKTLSYIRSVLETFQVPAVYVSHWVSDILFLCDEVVVLAEGRVVEQGAPSRLIGTMEALDPLRPPALKNIFTLAVLESCPDRGTVEADLGGQRLVMRASVPSSARHVTAMVAARDVILCRERPRLLSARNTIRGRVRRIASVGDHRIVFLDVGVEWMAEVTHESVEALHLTAGAEVYAVVKASAVQCVDARL